VQRYEKILKYARDFKIFLRNNTEKCNLSLILEIESNSELKYPPKFCQKTNAAEAAMIY